MTNDELMTELRALLRELVHRRLPNYVELSQSGEPLDEGLALATKAYRLLNESTSHVLVARHRLEEIALEAYLPVGDDA
jgi:hypothetical protein